MDKKKIIKKNILDEFECVLYDAQSMWLSDYCCSQQEEDEREEMDEKRLQYFKNLLERL